VLVFVHACCQVLACLPPDDSAFHARRAIQRRLFAAAHRLFQLGKSSYSSTQHGPNHGPATGSCEEGSCRSSSPCLPCAAVALVVVQLLLRPPSWALRSAPGADGAASSTGGSSSSTPSEAPSGEGHGAAALARGLRLAQALSNGADPDALLNPNSDEQQQEKAGGAHVSDEVRQLSKGGPPSLAELQVILYTEIFLSTRAFSFTEALEVFFSVMLAFFYQYHFRIVCVAFTTGGARSFAPRAAAHELPRETAPCCHAQQQWQQQQQQRKSQVHGLFHGRVASGRRRWRRWD